DANKSVYENFRSSGPAALVMGLQLVPGFQAMGALGRIATSGAVGALAEGGGQALDNATGQAPVANPGQRQLLAGVGGAATAAIPAAVGAVAQRIFKPSPA